MSGHSKWSKIKRAKGAADEARSKVFQKLAKELYVAAKSGDPSIEMNASLRMVVDKAKSANMPKDRIDAAIKKAAGSSNNEDYEAIRYEGYGAGGVAVMVDCLTDNKNRTASFVRAAFTKRGGNLGTDGSVAYMFNHRGILVFESDLEEDKVMEVALNNGAIDFSKEDSEFEIICEPTDFANLKKAIDELGIKEYDMCEVTYIATNDMEVDEATKEKNENLIDDLEDIDDVQTVYHNMK